MSAKTIEMEHSYLPSNRKNRLQGYKRKISDNPNNPNFSGMYEESIKAIKSIEKTINENFRYQSSFSEFAPIFNPYGGMYIPEFTQKPLDGSFHHQQQQPPYENFTNENFTESKENQYTSLNPVTSTNKIESFSELLNGRYGSYPTYEGEFSNLNETSQNGAEKSNENSTNSEEADENFGEIIKKSMVETVSA
ncbi:unnamed protein product [Psylliodes chrysocephalus]|uniref:Uncharacterized protein n=1 Tax=Psylliodes chrysocephalus TaxID=3402493 RepID=A0A9P0G7P9_9CUCU|nr:unnamed protein product [Psylliodes chrysocephala]